MSIFRRKTPKGQAYTPNPKPPQTYERTVYVPSLSRKEKRALGYLPKAQQPGEAHRRYRNGSWS